MRYAIFTDIHANLEALEAVLARIDELAQEEPIDQIWFLGDLVGYGPNPNECIAKLRERTDIIIAGNHDWAAVGKIDLDDFSEAARISAEWTAAQLTSENRTFLQNLPERIEKGEFLLVHGSPYGPLWEYLTSEVLAERSFQQFSNRFCLVGHTHVPIIFQQPDPVANAPTRPLEADEALEQLDASSLSDEETEEGPQIQNGIYTDDDPGEMDGDEEETATIAVVRPNTRINKDRSRKDIEQVTALHTGNEEIQKFVADATDAIAGLQQQLADDTPEMPIISVTPTELREALHMRATQADENDAEGEAAPPPADASEEPPVVVPGEDDEQEILEDITPEDAIQSAEERLNQEIEELLTLLGLSQSMIEVTNEMIVPPEGTWQAPTGYRAIINPGGIGQPRDGDPRAAFMIYDTARGFTFYRVPYAIEKTQEKIIAANLPQYLATRLAYGR